MLIPIIANLHYELRDYARAERMYNRLFRRAEAGEYPEERFKYARALKMNEKYQEAVIEFQNFLNESDDPLQMELAKIEMAGAEMAQEMPGNPQGVTVENMGKDVNTPTNEYSPAITPDGNTLIFSSINAKEVVYLDENDQEAGYAKIMSTGNQIKVGVRQTCWTKRSTARGSTTPM